MGIMGCISFVGSDICTSPDTVFPLVYTVSVVCCTDALPIKKAMRVMAMMIVRFFMLFQ